MTRPVTPQDTAALIGIGAQSIVDNAKRLGLVWQLRLATVIEAVSGDQLVIRLDGDETTITTVSMIGLVPSGLRVYVISVPPSGNFVVGWTGYEHQVMYGETGFETISFTTQTSFTLAVTFNIAFVGTPSVTTNIASAAGPTGGWLSRATAVTTTGFTLFLAGASATWASVPVNWTAVAPI